MQKLEIGKEAQGTKNQIELSQQECSDSEASVGRNMSCCHFDYIQKFRKDFAQNLSLKASKIADFIAPLNSQPLIFTLTPYQAMHSSIIPDRLQSITIFTTEEKQYLKSLLPNYPLLKVIIGMCILNYRRQYIEELMYMISRIVKYYEKQRNEQMHSLPIMSIPSCRDYTQPLQQYQIKNSIQRNRQTIISQAQECARAIMPSLLSLQFLTLQKYTSTFCQKEFTQYVQGVASIIFLALEGFYDCDDNTFDSAQNNFKQGFSNEAEDDSYQDQSEELKQQGQKKIKTD